jgi:hypothetical protein
VPVLDVLECGSSDVRWRRVTRFQYYSSCQLSILYSSHSAPSKLGPARAECLGECPGESPPSVCRVEFAGKNRWPSSACSCSSTLIVIVSCWSTFETTPKTTVRPPATKLAQAKILSAPGRYWCSVPSEPSVVLVSRYWVLYNYAKLGNYKYFPVVPLDPATPSGGSSLPPILEMGRPPRALPHPHEHLKLGVTHIAV